MKDIVLAVNYRPEVMVSVLKKSEEEFGIAITFSVETEPLGTGTYTSLVTSTFRGVSVVRNPSRHQALDVPEEWLRLMS